MRNPLSLPALIDWLRTMPADEEYNWMDPQNCLLGRYFRHLGACEVGAIWWRDASNTPQRIPLRFESIAYGHTGPSTFGAALARAERALGAEREGAAS